MKYLLTIILILAISGCCYNIRNIENLDDCRMKVKKWYLINERTHFWHYDGEILGKTECFDVREKLLPEGDIEQFYYNHFCINRVCEPFEKVEKEYKNKPFPSCYKRKK